MRRALVVVVGLALVGGLVVVVSGFVIAHARQAEFLAFDAWEAEGAKLAALLADGPGEPFACTGPLTSKNPGKAFMRVVDFSGSLRAFDGVELPLEDRPRVLYFAEGGIEARRSTIEGLREYRTDPWATSRSILREPSTLKELVTAMPILRAPSMEADVAVTMLARSVEEVDGRVWLMADVAVASTGSSEMACRGQVEVDLGDAKDSDHLRVRRLAEAVQQLVQQPKGLSESGG